MSELVKCGHQQLCLKKIKEITNKSRYEFPYSRIGICKILEVNNASGRVTTTEMLINKFNNQYNSID